VSHRDISNLDCVELLTDKERNVLDLHFYQGCTYNEIGKSIGVSRERVRQIKQEGLDKLKANIKVD
jgi:RNA polymerase sigma factor (sigma-70 family)